MLGIKLYNVWKEAKGVFVKPTLKVRLMKTPYLQSIRLYKYYTHIHVVNRDRVYIPVVKYNENGKYTDTVPLPKHKLPCPLWSKVWTSRTRRKLRKWHLAWIPPIINVPRFLTFGIKNLDLGCKTKFGEFRFEDSPELSFIFFGITLQFTLQVPKGKYCDEYNYWECLLEYIWGRGDRDIFKTLKCNSFWTRGYGEDAVSYFSLRPEFLTERYQKEYGYAVEKIKTINTKYLNVI